MHQGHRLARASLLAVVLLCGLAGSAPANRLSVSERAFRLVWNPNKMSAYLGTMETGLEKVASCNVTMEGSFHSSTFLKSSSAPVGQITRAAVATETCVGGTIALLTETLPWQLSYASFTGVLPVIRQVIVNVVGLSMLVTASGTGECLLRSTTTNPMVERVELDTRTSAIEGFSSEEATVIPAGGLLCFRTQGTYEGNATVTRLGATSSVSVTLI